MYSTQGPLRCPSKAPVIFLLSVFWALLPTIFMQLQLLSLCPFPRVPSGHLPGHLVALQDSPTF